VPILDAVHDFAHPVESDGAWSESYYFNGYDPDADCGFFTRIGVRPNEGTLDAGLSVWLPGTDIATVHGVRPQAEMTDSALEAAGVRYERLVPMRAWRLTCDAEATLRDLGRQRATRKTRLRMDLRFDTLTPAVGVDGSPRAGDASAAAGQTTGKGHLEQAGRITGWMEADGHRHEIAAARGNRDKSWGPRRWGGPTFWRWFSVNLGDDMQWRSSRDPKNCDDVRQDAAQDIRGSNRTYGCVYKTARLLYTVTYIPDPKPTSTPKK